MPSFNGLFAVMPSVKTRGPSFSHLVDLEWLEE
uniref:Uncharacterized protein n=1 Tax=Picea glauca TaxID=3330 RepID=A0A124GP85_PICGL|nr:hypothetical protein ABT39_MTgene1019 [Picea glauca]